MTITAQAINSVLESYGMDTSGAFGNELIVYYEDETISIVLCNEDFGKNGKVGVHCKPRNVEDVVQALAKAERDMFPAVFVYIDSKPKLTLVKG